LGYSGAKTIKDAERADSQGKNALWDEIPEKIQKKGVVDAERKKSGHMRTYRRA